MDWNKEWNRERRSLNSCWTVLFRVNKYIFVNEWKFVLNEICFERLNLMTYENFVLDGVKIYVSMVILRDT